MEDITAITGVTEVRRLNNNLQTLTGTMPPSISPQVGRFNPQLVQLTVGTTIVDAPPVANFTWRCERKRCTFDASSSSDDKGIVSYVWDFDKEHGGGKHSGVIISTTYPKAGTFQVLLTVTDTKGQKSSVTKAVTLP